MIVYRVNVDLDYQGVMYDDVEQPGSLNIIKAEPMGDVTFPTCYISSLKEKRGNFFRFSSGNLLMDDVADTALKTVFPADSEYYPVEVEELGTLTYVNIIVKVDALDEDKTRWRHETDGSRNIIMRHAFHAAKLDAVPSLFRIPQNRYSKLLTVTGRASQKDDFYTRYHEAGLTGLTFQKLWSDEG